MAKKSSSLEANIQKLEYIAGILDDGSAPLEELLVAYEEGMKIAKETRTMLEKAELKIIDITKNSEDNE